jgi:hypothetical protein
MMVKTKLILTVIIGFAIILATARAQWPGNPDDNLMISNILGEQTIPLVEADPSGGCFITWYDHSSGNYCMIMQHLNASGEITMQQNGLVISSHAQDTWLTDYDLAVDDEGNAIVVFNDIRSGPDWDIYAYKISPTGQFLWGEDGLTISANDNGEFTPMVVTTTDGNIVFAWPKETDVSDVFEINIFKVSPDGDTVWNGRPVVQIQSDYGFTIPRIVAADNGSVIIQALKRTEFGFFGHQNLVLYKLDTNGNNVWVDSGIVISSAGGFLWHMKPFLASDGEGGAYSYWYDSRNNEQHVYVQHTLANGAVCWDTDGLLVSTDPAELQMDPRLVVIPGSGDIIVTYLSTYFGQAIGGIGVQRIDSLGQRLWSDTGIVIVPRDTRVISQVNALGYAGGEIVTYLEEFPSGSQSSVIRGIRLDNYGQFTWPDTFIEFASYQVQHAYLQSTINYIGQAISVWVDGREDPSGDIYLQNLNPDGTLGVFELKIEDSAIETPAKFQVYGNYPNPFNGKTKIEYAISNPSLVTIDVFDILGRKVETLYRGRQETGHHYVIWDAAQYGSGTYFYRIKTDSGVITKKGNFLK